MVKTYSNAKDGERTLSKHFKVKEFRSIAGNKLTTDKIQINDDLVTKLEKLIEELGATKAVITSGYRDSVCDKLVGGSGRGQHVEGNAADVIFYNGNALIDVKRVCCVAQDLGFGGIARINERAVHLDVRTGKRYLGDETKGTNSVTTDFYKYFNIKKQNNRDLVKARFGLAEETMKFLDTYKYSEDLYKKLLK